MPAGGREATEVVRAAVGERPDLVEHLRAEVRDALGAYGLLVADRGRVLGMVPRTRWVRTPTGEVWEAVPRELERDGPVAAPGVSPAVGLLLALDQAAARAVRSRDDAPVPAVPAGEIDGDTLDAVLGDVGAGLDGAVDGGSSSGDGGGDGGGGD